tara:strand:+ start:4566 stop:5357 length:792 start_codon:yes stop_codon:yes gene_type:complete
MSEKLKSEGTCLFCSMPYKKAGIHRHLQKHLEEKAVVGRPGKSFLLKVETDKSWGSTPYFLSIWMDGEAKMSDLDFFLRSIWLECCGHMSSFTNPREKPQYGGAWDFFEAQELLEKGKIKEYETMMELAKGEVPMSRKAKAVFEEKLTLEYQYDFGSTTALEITAMSEYPIKAYQKIVLLSRNEPLGIMCSSCGKNPATQICTVCCYEEEAQFCDNCAKKHAKKCDDFDEYAAMPVVNSPRMGVCGYEGGDIDIERDGIIKQV